MTTQQPVSDTGVRTARRADVSEVAAVQAVVWRAAYGDLVDGEVRAAFTPDAFAAVWEASLRNPPSPRHRLLVATEGERIVGFVAIGPDAQQDDVGEISALAVGPERRGTGNGSRLLNAAVDTLRANEFQALHMWVLADDEPTRAFLGAAGVQPDGAWRERVVAADGRTVREVRLAADLSEDTPTTPAESGQPRG